MSKEKLNMLLIEDDSGFRQTMQKSFGNLYRIINAVNKKTALMAVQHNQIDLIVLDLYLDGSQKMVGLQLIAPCKTYQPNTPIIVVTKNPDSQTVVKALHIGADDFVRKNEFDAEKMKLLFDRHILKRKRSKKQQISNFASTPPTANDSTKKHSFIGESPKIKELKKYLTKLSEHPDITVLLTGESGVGKEVAAHYLHQSGVRQDQPFEAVHLSMVTETLLESILFGHRKGSFTDANKDTMGAFERANGGILFLDEIGEIDANIQVKLLRFLEDKVITPIGGEKITLDVQIVAATNKNLEKEVEQGNFRLDLYHRLKQFPLEIPPLRERPDDIPLIINHYLASMGTTKAIFTEVVWERLIQHHWSGNIRELINTIKSMCLKRDLLDKQQIDESLLPKSFFKTVLEKEQGLGVVSARTELAQIEKELLKNKGSKSKTAAHFQMSLDNLRYKINRFHEKYPEIFDHYPEISKKYKLY